MAVAVEYWNVNAFATVFAKPAGGRPKWNGARVAAASTTTYANRDARTPSFACAVLSRYLRRLAKPLAGTPSPLVQEHRKAQRAAKLGYASIMQQTCHRTLLPRLRRAVREFEKLLTERGFLLYLTLWLNTSGARTA